MNLWRWLVAWLVWLSSDPAEIDRQAPRAAAAVAAARSSMVVDVQPAPPGPAPADCVCGGTCKNGVWKPDGRVEQPCTCKCERCRKKPAAPCPDGKCPAGR